jgi:histidinol-phosphate aminotransferase
MSSPKPNDHLNIIQPYKGGKRSVPGVEKVYKLSSNENPFGASNSAMKVFKESSKDLGFYPVSSNTDLVKAFPVYGLA